MKTKVLLSSHLYNQLMLAIPALMVLYAFLLFVLLPSEIGLDYWRPARNVIICIYLILLFVKLLKKDHKLYISPKLWTIGLLLSVFSWAVGGFVFDLINVFQIFGEIIQ